MEKNVFLLVTALCGTALSSDVASRISNGQVAPENYFPYAISLQQISQVQDITRGHRCGGVLVTYQHALTAATCTFDTVNGIYVQINADEYRVFVGSVLLTNDVQDRVRRVANFTVHPQFLANQPLNNNIAIITLTTPFQCNSVSPQSLPAPEYLPTGACTVAGWGSQNLTATANTQLMFLNKTIIDNAICSLLYITPPNSVTILPTMVCAATPLQTSSGCTGDMGNALVCSGILAGLLNLANNCTPSLNPEVYTRISSYTTWIRNITVTPVPCGASIFQPGVALLAMFTVIQIISARIIS